MSAIFQKLSSRLAEKGLSDNEMHLFIKDVLRILQVLPSVEVEMINNRLCMLGWNCEADYATIQLISACNETDARST